MEKRSPRCQLSVIKTLIEEGKVRSTFSALAGGAALGFDFQGIVAVVLALTPKTSINP
jgi:motility quorum-sensing regulator/GCU-specific mRNA interferase toxin